MTYGQCQTLTGPNFRNSCGLSKVMMGAYPRVSTATRQWNALTKASNGTALYCSEIQYRHDIWKEGPGLSSGHPPDP